MSKISHEALSALKNNQRQLDMDGCEVGVSRQALDEAVTFIEAVVAEIEMKFAEALASHANQSSGVVSQESPDLRGKLREARNQALDDAADAIEKIAHEGLHESMWSRKFQAAASVIRAMKEEG